MDKLVQGIETYNKVKDILTSNSIIVSDYKEISYGLQFVITLSNNWSGIIRIFQNKKGEVKIDYSQLKEDSESLQIQQLIEGYAKIGFREQPSENSQVNLDFPIIGTDESGKGDYFGPLVSASVFVDDKTATELASLKVRDSKNISDSKILELAKEIRKLCQDSFVIVEVSPERYNSLYEQFKRENKSLNHLLAWGHAKAIEDLLQKVQCDTVLVDKFADDSVIISKLQNKGKKLKVVQMPKAEQNLSVAAASIIARDRFLHRLSQLSDKYKLHLPKGSSKQVVVAAQEFVARYGKTELSKAAKLHFKISDRVLE
ncbi:MAG: ribonuclease HIII [Chloroflexaceae bacterium]|nr:ribonuclease HIII [Chloroflexaceae bacterium]